MGRNWWQILLRGIVAILFGVLIFLDPATLVTFIGALALVDGVFGIVQAVQHRGQPHWVWMLLEGIVGVIFGVLVLFNLLGAAIAITIVIGAWSIVTGILEIVQAIRLRREIQGEFWLGLAGVLSIVFGVLAILFPLTTFLTLAWLVAGFAIVFGVMLIFLAFRVRGEYNRSGTGSTSAA
jgi:uncharacterized membrane protein HdeD (DUF308 family)